jgi:hypothetical protein
VVSFDETALAAPFPALAPRPSLTAADTKDEFMTRRIFAALNRALLAEPAHSEQVHFHQDSHGRPAPCYDAQCSSPRLDVA